MAKVSVIGSGFSSLAAACVLAKNKSEVTIFEKNQDIGGRARQFKEQGFTFDMGPSWYWMPDVFEDFFRQFGKTSKDYYELVKLDPSFRIYYGKKDFMDIPDSYEELRILFENLEPGSATALDKFMKNAEYKYNTGMKDLVYKPGNSITEFASLPVMLGIFKLHLFKSFDKYLRSHFRHPKLISLMEFPILFLGAMPEETPALYSLMNYAGLKLGTWYPMGGMYKIVEAMQTLAESLGVEFKTGTPVTGMNSSNGYVTELLTHSGAVKQDLIIAGADYHHVEQDLLTGKNRQYSEKYWDSRRIAPSCLLAYIGVNKNVKNLLHHNLFFHEDFGQHAVEIYRDPKWPTKPLFYVCCPSKTDPSVAPEGMENIFLLMPLAPGLEDSEQDREKYFQDMVSKMEEFTGDSIKEHIIYKKLYCLDDFKTDYNAYKGNAYGLANTLRQTAILKPGIKTTKLKNLFFTGHLTVPGPGVPPALISGQVAAKEAFKFIHQNENTF